MKILNISQTDWAKFQWDNCQSLRAVGLICDSVTLEKHSFYSDAEQSATVNIDYIKAVIGDYDIIQFFHDNVNLYTQLLPYFHGKRVFVYHTSSYYRAHSQMVNGIMFDAEKHIACMPEFVAMHPKAIYQVGAVDTEKIKPGDWKQGKELTFAHYPSNSTVKGTAKIIELMANKEVKFKHSTELVSYENQLKRMNECDVYIEMFTEKDGNGSDYGDFGITALEVASMGKAVITNSRQRHENHYANTYGRSFFWSANTEYKFNTIIGNFMRSDNLLQEAKKSARDLVVKYHSYKATGEYFIKNILNGQERV